MFKPPLNCKIDIFYRQIALSVRQNTSVECTRAPTSDSILRSLSYDPSWPSMAFATTRFSSTPRRGVDRRRGGFLSRFALSEDYSSLWMQHLLTAEFAQLCLWQVAPPPPHIRVKELDGTVADLQCGIAGYKQRPDFGRIVGCVRGYSSHKGHQEWRCRGWGLPSGWNVGVCGMSVYSMRLGGSRGLRGVVAWPAIAAWFLFPRRFERLQVKLVSFRIALAEVDILLG